MFTNEELDFIINSIIIAGWESVEEDDDKEMAEQLIKKLRKIKRKIDA